VTTATSPDVVNVSNAWNSLWANRANWVTGKQLLNRLTKYTANAYSDYRFSDGRLRGLRVGYGMQFRGPQVIGYRGADTMVNPANPTRAIDDPKVDAYTPCGRSGISSATATLGYPVKMFGARKVDLNLSITNLFDYDTPALQHGRPAPAQRRPHVAGPRELPALLQLHHPAQLPPLRHEDVLVFRPRAARHHRGAHRLPPVLIPHGPAFVSVEPTSPAAFIFPLRAPSPAPPLSTSRP
jgi:hypothetical protein